MIPARYRVTGRDQVLVDTVTLDLDPLDAPLGPMRPGQFCMLWAPGVGEVPISLAEVPGPSGRQRHTVRAVGTVTRALCAARTGDVVGVRGPFGTAWGIEEAGGGDVVVVAGGIGLAPLRPVVTAVLADRDRYGRVAVLVGARTPDDLLYAGELAEWRSRFDLEVRVTVDAAPASWHGDVGVVTTLIARTGFDPANATAFVCGPEVMMRFAARALAERGVDPGRIVVSLERTMTCGIAQCGHCQLGPVLVCREGPVLPWSVAGGLLEVRER